MKLLEKFKDKIDNELIDYLVVNRYEELLKLKIYSIPIEELSYSDKQIIFNQIRCSVKHKIKTTIFLLQEIEDYEKDI